MSSDRQLDKNWRASRTAWRSKNVSIRFYHGTSNQNDLLVSKKINKPSRDRSEEVSQVSAVPSPVTTADALEMLTSAMSYLAAADATAMAAREQAECLQVFEQVTAMQAAARTSVLAGFIAGQGYCDDAAYSPRSWLIHQTRITKGAATAHTA
jgi:hypothetical protein